MKNAGQFLLSMVKELDTNEMFEEAVRLEKLAKEESKSTGRPVCDATMAAVALLRAAASYNYVINK
jgi:hypothetical protein